MKIEYSKHAAGCCILCRGAVLNGAYVVNNFELLCEDCVKAIADFVNEREKANSKKFKCSRCGKDFDSKGALLAHYKKCKKKKEV